MARIAELRQKRQEQAQQEQIGDEEKRNLQFAQLRLSAELGYERFRIFHPIFYLTAEECYRGIEMVRNGDMDGVRELMDLARERYPKYTGPKVELPDEIWDEAQDAIAAG